MCANNYLGLADNRELAEAAKAAYDAYGCGLASVRFICGTQSIHKQLEAAVSRSSAPGHHPLLLLLRCQRRPV